MESGRVAVNKEDKRQCKGLGDWRRNVGGRVLARRHKDGEKEEEEDWQEGTKGMAAKQLHRFSVS